MAEIWEAVASHIIYLYLHKGQTNINSEYTGIEKETLTDHILELIHIIKKFKKTKFQAIRYLFCIWELFLTVMQDRWEIFSNVHLIFFKLVMHICVYYYLFL